ncbi:MAG: hypothetical protein HY998_08750 [candidate division NC10 bacterium]|nr:hypothetical protein [candidate division NC10 bacterium]
MKSRTVIKQYQAREWDSEAARRLIAEVLEIEPGPELDPLDCKKAAIYAGIIVYRPVTSPDQGPIFMELEFNRDRLKEFLSKGLKRV